MTEEELPAQLREVLRSLREVAHRQRSTVGVSCAEVERIHGRGQHVAAALSDLVRAGLVRRMPSIGSPKLYLPVDR